MDENMLSVSLQLDDKCSNIKWTETNWLYKYDVCIVKQTTIDKPQPRRDWNFGLDLWM